ncbi:nucleoside hydrolase [Pseudovirgaria hyperparasitica]|uniref:Nucleoside hydrolase n=1 Tax=Pseudovirgaria hyperparasitica TaxID=470096 RepID=A0A6A6WJJ5_9PEZI|nr:nucleoside hydrolase [Pseudovirgaria hyperparasitica]KAF2761521.1 nucleoside hydrolase [Pseudovirgaria hyperparasitica]
MANPQRIIIDTDPGVDDVSALLLALSAKPEELEVALISVTYGNVDVQSCLRNVVAVFHFIEKEQEWRRSQGLPEGFETLKASKPIVAIGASGPLGDQVMMADYFHGIDGLGGISHTHPHLTPPEAWKNLFTATSSSTTTTPTPTPAEIKADAQTLFTPSNTPAHLEMLNLLRANPPDTISIIAVGPLTNCALAAASDPETFLRAKEVIVMGGTIAETGNVTPCAEFNTFADAIAAARVFALTSPSPSTTMPPSPPPTNPPHPHHLTPYPHPLSRPLNLTLFPLDLTSKHMLHRTTFNRTLAPLLASTPPSPLATWSIAFMSSTFDKVAALHHSTPGLTMHDPLCVYYVLQRAAGDDDDDESGRGWTSVVEDIRVETAGQWTRGMMVVDRRDRNRRVEHDDDEIREVPGDSGNWLSVRAGNRVRRVTGSLGGERFERDFLARVFGGFVG